MISVSSIALVRNDRVPDNALRVEVWGQQYAWTFLYPPAGKVPGEDEMACVERDAGRIVDGCKAAEPPPPRRSRDTPVSRPAT